VKYFKRINLFTGMFASMAVSAFCQEWYAGANGGYGFAPSLTVKGPSGSANTGLDNGYGVGAFFGADTYQYWGGEVGYLYRQSDLKLESGGTSVRFSAHTNIIHFDSLWHFRPRESKIRPFVAVGVGARVLNGTGAESASQPLGNLAALTHTTEATPLGDVGIGVKANFHNSWQLRVEVHDYISPLPSKVIAAAPGASISGWLNDIIPTVSIAYHW
jgi:hypothetical protein